MRESGVGTIGVWTLLSQIADDISIRLTERFADAFDTFDPKTAGRLGSVLSAIDSARAAMQLPPPSKEAVPDWVAKKLLDGVLEKIDVAVYRNNLALKSLAPYREADSSLDEATHPPTR